MCDFIEGSKVMSNSMMTYNMATKLHSSTGFSTLQTFKTGFAFSSYNYMLHNKSFQDVETTFKIDNSHIETG
jgi:formylmethanofuran dehydrogenase subunit A